MDPVRLGAAGRALAPPARAAAAAGGRLAAIDAFRGLTIVLMVFVNELAGVAGVPAWLKHMPADADAMTLVDGVFPAFLFIVGLSMPIAFELRWARGEGTFDTARHVAARTLALVVLGVFMVNAESGHNEATMPLPIALWTLLSYAAAIAVWSGGPRLLRGVGVMALVALALVWRGGVDGSERMSPQWWGILGLIGWAYLIACIAHQLVRGRAIGLAAMVGVCIGVAVLGVLPGHMVHAAIVLCGATTTAIVHRGRPRLGWPHALLFAAVLLAAGAVLRPWLGISKIYATPTWALWSAAACIVIHLLLNRLSGEPGFARWTRPLEPAASNPLLAYMLPYIVFAAMQLAGVSWPAALRAGLPGVLWAAVYALLVVALVGGLNRANIRLKM